MGLAVIPFTSLVTRSCKLYPSFISHLCVSVPAPSHAVTHLLGADALSELPRHGFVRLGAAASENSP